MGSSEVYVRRGLGERGGGERVRHGEFRGMC